MRRIREARVELRCPEGAWWCHVLPWLWVHATPARLRIAACRWFLKHQHRDWCQLVNSWSLADLWDFCREDYVGPIQCLCAYPMPWHAGPPQPGWCYCPTPLELMALEAES